MRQFSLIDLLFAETVKPCIGAINGANIEIIKPKEESAVDYFTRKQKYTIDNQALCDGNLV